MDYSPYLESLFQNYIRTVPSEETKDTSRMEAKSEYCTSKPLSPNMPIERVTFPFVSLTWESSSMPLMKLPILLKLSVSLSYHSDSYQIIREATSHNPWERLLSVTILRATAISHKPWEQLLDCSHNLWERLLPVMIPENDCYQSQFWEWLLSVISLENNC